jgi:hypothetical protein
VNQQKLQPTFGSQNPSGANFQQRQQEDAGNAGGSSQVASLFAQRLGGVSQTANPQALQGVQNANNNGSQFGLNFPRPPEGAGIKLPALYA